MTETRAVVREVDGKLVLDDPDAVAMMGAVAKHNCKQIALEQADRVRHFVDRIEQRGLTGADVLIVLLNVNDPHGAQLAEVLMPGHNWQSTRDRGEVPFARGLAQRAPLQKLIATLDASTGEELERLSTAVLVMDYSVAAVFEASSLIGG